MKRLAVAGVALAILAVMVVGPRLSSPDPRTSTDPVLTPGSVVADAGTDPGLAAIAAVEEPAGDGSVSASNETEGGVQDGNDATGALDAAVRFLEATEEVVNMSPADAAGTQRSISSMAEADRLSSEVEQQMRDLLAAAPSGIEVWVAPIESRVVEIPTGFEASIWYAEIVAVGDRSVTVSFKTITYDLVWENQSWKMAGSTAIAGPTPAPSADVATPPLELISVLQGFDDAALAR